MPNYLQIDPVRLGILRYIKALYLAATATDPAPTGKRTYGVDFSVVEIGPLSGIDNRKRNAVGISAGPEKKADLYPVKNNSFDINIEFRVTWDKNDADPGILAELYLGIAQQIMYDDDTLGGNIIKFDEVHNEVDLQTYADRTIQGLVRFTVLYRQTFANVYTTNPSV